MAVYGPLGEYLKKSGAGHIPMTFHDVESVIGRKLPASAYRHRPWWANEERGHSHAKAWLQAGYLTEQVDMAAGKLVFARANSRGSAAEEAKTFVTNSESSTKQGRHPLIGCMKGTFTIEPGWDLTKPALDPEDLAEWEASLDRKADMIAAGMTQKTK